MNKMMIMHKQLINTLNKIVYVCLFVLVCCPISLAEVAQSLTPGHGAFPAPEIAGDSFTQPTPTNINTHWTGSIFPTKVQQIPQTIYLRTNTYSHNTHQFMGKRTVFTIRPLTLQDPIKLDLIMTILQTDLSLLQQQNNHSSWIVDINQQQWEQIQMILAPASDHLSAKKLSSQPWFFSYLPIVRQFSRYAVLLGIVFATVLLTFAAWSITSGERGGAQRFVNTCIGLIILLSAFTIYRLLLSNTANTQKSTLSRFLPLFIMALVLSLTLSSNKAYAQPRGLDYFSVNTSKQTTSKTPPANKTTDTATSPNSSIVSWFEKFDLLREQYRPTESDKVILTRPLMQEAERVQQWTNTATKVSKRYLLLAKSIRSLTVPPGMSDVKEYRDLTADWYQDAAGIYQELIRPRPAARTIEDLKEQLDTVKKRSEGLAENISNLKSMDHSIRQHYNVHMAFQDDAIQQFVRSK